MALAEAGLDDNVLAEVQQVRFFLHIYLILDVGAKNNQYEGHWNPR